jgi:hypothetical protein
VQALARFAAKALTLAEGGRQMVRLESGWLRIARAAAALIVGWGCSDDATEVGSGEPSPGGTHLQDGAPQGTSRGLELRCLGDCTPAMTSNTTNAEGAAEFARLRQAQTAPLTFDMGEARASREFLFLLVNAGETDVTNITLSSSNPRFAVEPATIDRLPPQQDATVLPIVRVAAEHGIALNGVGSVALLPMGANTATLNIAGSSGGSATSVVADLQVTARVMDVELRDGAQVVDLTASTASFSSTLGGLGFVVMHYAANPSIVNTGNVDIEVSTYDSAGSNTASAVSTLSVGGTLTMLPGSGVRLQSNTVADASRFQIGNDGAVYFFTISPGGP